MSNVKLDNRLPKGWRIARFDEFLRRIERKLILDDSASYNCVGVRWYGLGAFVRERLLGMGITRKQQWIIKAGDVVYNKLFAWKGAFTIADDSIDGCIVSDKFPTYEVNLAEIDPRFLGYYFRAPMLAQQAQDLSKGAAAISKLTLNPPQFWDLTIPLPPLDEQRRIVARIEELAAKIEEARGLRQQAMEEGGALAKAAMRQIFGGSGEYQKVSLESVCAAIIDNLHSNPVYADEGIPCVRSPDVGWGKLYLDTAFKTNEEEYKRRTVRGEPMPDDIVLVREGGGTGKAAIVEKGQRFSLGQRVMMLRPNRSFVISKFFLYQILSPAIYEEQILPFCKGSASPHLNIGALRKFAFSLPSLSEQRRIVNYLDNLQAKVDALKRLQAETAAELDALLPSVLDKAFRGEL